jgi:hypothetical protein
MADYKTVFESHKWYILKYSNFVLYRHANFNSVCIIQWLKTGMNYEYVQTLHVISYTFFITG